MSSALRRWLIFATGLVGLRSTGDAARMLAVAGFVNVEVVERGQWLADLARRDLARMEGPLWSELVAARGEEAAQDAVEFWRLMLDVLDNGDFCPVTLKAQKPA